jgi:hypothetical protein
VSGVGAGIDAWKRTRGGANKTAISSKAASPIAASTSGRRNLAQTNPPQIPASAPSTTKNGTLSDRTSAPASQPSAAPNARPTTAPKKVFTRFDMMLPDSRSSQLFDNEEEVHPVSPHRPERNVWYNRDDLALQAVQELLEFTLICRHPDLETVNSVFHGRAPSIE